MTLWGVQGHSRSLLVSPSLSCSWGRLGRAGVDEVEESRHGLGLVDHPGVSIGELVTGAA